MTNSPFSFSFITIFFFFFFFFIPFFSPPFPAAVNGLGSASTIAVTFGTGTVCGIVAGEPTQRIQCYQNGQTLQVLPNVSFQAISGGRSFFCGLRSGGFTLLCWDTTNNPSNPTLQPKRLYHNNTVQLTDLTVGDSQVCAREVDSGIVKCWRGIDENGHAFPSPHQEEELGFREVTSGSGFSCGIVMGNNIVQCWGHSGSIGGEIQRQFENLSMSTLVAGESHACGITTSGTLICKGLNNSGQLTPPLTSSSVFSGLALGSNFSCGIRSKNGLVVCWRGGITRTSNVSFESIVAGLDYVCGLTTSNLSVICWGNGWSNTTNLGMVIPGPCVDDSSSCTNSCGTYPNSEILCHGSGSICNSCQTQNPLAVPLPPSPNPQISPSQQTNTRELVIFLIIGSVGGFVGLCSILYCLWIGTCRFLSQKADSSVQPTETTTDIVEAFPLPTTSSTTIRSFSSKRQSSRTLRRSGSSSKHIEKTESFTFSELASATNNFSPRNEIGSGSFGVVYRGKLVDGREVAIKRGETLTNSSNKHKHKNHFQEKEVAFDSELALLSRLNHKHLVGLIGFCEENHERLLVYEFLPNGSLHDHLHSKSNTQKSSSAINSWRIRIKIALDAARGIEYLHNYAVPSIIHRDIKSSNILLDSNWNAKVSDFGLSLLGPPNPDQESTISTRAAGTVGYIDPEYYVLNVLTTKSDVYGLGVVMLELLTGKRAVFKSEEEEGGRSSPMGVAEYAGPRIGGGELWSVLDYRVGEPEVNESEGLEIMAYTAMHCVNLEGKERPSVSEIVGNLERALAFVEGSPGSFSITAFSAPFE